MSIFEFNERVYIRNMKKRERQKGIENGQFLSRIHFVRKKMEKGLSVAEMADILEEKEEEIQSIYDLLLAYAEESDEALYERYRRISRQ